MKQESFLLAKSNLSDRENKTLQEKPIGMLNVTSNNTYTQSKSNQTSNDSKHVDSDDKLWEIPLTFVTDINTSKTLKWFGEKGNIE